MSSDTLEDDPDLTHIVAGELRLLDPAVRRSPADAGLLLDPDFREFGAFGRSGTGRRSWTRWPSRTRPRPPPSR